MRVILEAPAKVNLTLDVLDRRADGYHELDTLMQSVRLYDVVQVQESQAAQTDFLGFRVRPDNTVMRAIRAYALRAGASCQAHVTVRKYIPTRAGLGGGSADAAATLLGMQAIYGALTKQGLLEAALQVGADVPFCLQGGLARARGIGERLTPLNGMCLHLLIVKPCAGVSTAELFKELKLPVAHPNTTHALRAIETKDAHALGRHVFNSLEATASCKVPHIVRIKRRMLALGALGASMSGSGSAVFGLFENSKAAARAAASFSSYPLVRVCDTIV